MDKNLITNLCTSIESDKNIHNVSNRNMSTKRNESMHPGVKKTENQGMDKVKEDCGIFGIYDPDGDSAKMTYYGLFALQHRGQQSCGIAVNKDREIRYYRNVGLVNEVFNDEILEKLEGHMAIGHVRYSSESAAEPENTEPLVIKYIKGTLAIALNGSLINRKELTNEFAMTGAIFQTTSDSEIIAYAVARERATSPSVEVAISKAMRRLEGAYSVVLMSPKKLIAFRDPNGIRPLCMGRRGKQIVFASESCALDAIGAVYEREVAPGEILVAEKGELRSLKDHMKDNQKESNLCVFEYIYFARPDSDIYGLSVYESRKIAGRCLAKKDTVEADVVVGVPDSGLGAAMGYSEQSGIPFAEGFVKNRYIGRTFINPGQENRVIAVKIKLNALRSNIVGKRVIMVDDSIVRGTTSAKIVSQLREVGAKEVHVRISSPPFLWQCFYGTDVPTRKELLACNYSLEEIRKKIGADSLEFLDVEDLELLANKVSCGFCDACFTGNYPFGGFKDSQTL